MNGEGEGPQQSPAGIVGDRAGAHFLLASWQLDLCVCVKKKKKTHFLSLNIKMIQTGRKKDDICIFNSRGQDQERFPIPLSSITSIITQLNYHT